MVFDIEYSERTQRIFGFIRADGHSEIKFAKKLTDLCLDTYLELPTSEPKAISKDLVYINMSSISIIIENQSKFQAKMN